MITGQVQLDDTITALRGGAHDLNNVLSPILTAVDLLLLRVADERSQRLLNILHTNAVRGSEMVKQVLTFARGVEGDYILLQPNYLIKEIVKILKDTLPKILRSLCLIRLNYGMSGETPHNCTRS